MTTMPMAKPASLPSLRVVTPSATPMMAKTRQASGNANRCCLNMISLWGDRPAATFTAAWASSWAMVNSLNPRLGDAPAPNTDFGSMWVTSSIDC